MLYSIRSKCFGTCAAWEKHSLPAIHRSITPIRQSVYGHLFAWIVILSPFLLCDMRICALLVKQQQIDIHRLLGITFRMHRDNSVIFSLYAYTYVFVFRFLCSHFSCIICLIWMNLLTFGSAIDVNRLNWIFDVILSEPFLYIFPLAVGKTFNFYGHCEICLIFKKGHVWSREVTLRCQNSPPFFVAKRWFIVIASMGQIC